MLNLVIEVDGGLSEVDAPKHHDVVFYEFDLLVLPLDVVQAALGVSSRTCGVHGVEFIANLRALSVH